MNRGCAIGFGSSLGCHLSSLGLTCHYCGWTKPPGSGHGADWVYQQWRSSPNCHWLRMGQGRSSPVLARCPLAESRRCRPRIVCRSRIRRCTPRDRARFRRFYLKVVSAPRCNSPNRCLRPSHGTPGWERLWKSVGSRSSRGRTGPRRIRPCTPRGFSSWCLRLSPKARSYLIRRHSTMQSRASGQHARGEAL